jgi:hypothetical protein
VLRAGLAQSVERRAKGWTSGVRFPAGVRFCVVHIIETDSLAHTVSYPVGSWGFSPGVKLRSREPDHSPPSRARVNNGGAVPPSLKGTIFFYV